MRKRKRKQEEVELNLAAMLDMAFQLLTFFILTFRPAPVEGQVFLRMPLPQPVAARQIGETAGQNPESTNPLAALDTLVISAVSNETGGLRQIVIGDTTLNSSLPALDRKLSQLLAAEGSAFQQVIIQVDSRLRYQELMGVIDVCTRQKLPSGEPLTRLSFVEA
ncbi:MAG: biopolymer transporter ExbD [Planctomycetaceae bacterium]|nr:biopolymer transporter ExbD [Planctomycetaceae bacterium]